MESAGWNNQIECDSKSPKGVLAYAAACLLGKQNRLPKQPAGDLVARAGFEPAISALRGRCPGPLDERAVLCAEADIGWDGESRTPVDGTRIRCPTTRRHPKMPTVRENIDYRNARTNARGKVGRNGDDVRDAGDSARCPVFIHGRTLHYRRFGACRGGAMTHTGSEHPPLQRAIMRRGPWESPPAS